MSEAFLRRFHEARPGITSAALARTGSYERLWARVEAALRDDAATRVHAARVVEARDDAAALVGLDDGAATPAPRVLDLACGDRPMPGAIGLDLVRERGVTVQGRAQALPFKDAAFDAVVCHLAFMLFDDIEGVAGELHRVLAPGGSFHALLGGGPTAGGADAFHAFTELLPRSQRLGDSRANDWRALFGRSRGWSEPVLERWPLDLTGRFDDVWQFLGASYQLRDPEPVRAALRARFPTDPVPCTVATYYACVTR